MAKLAFLGLGVMGYPMAGHLVAAGHDVTVYNRTSVKADAWAKQHGGRAAPTPAEAVDSAEIAFACVGRDADLREITLGEDGAFAAMGQRTLFVDHTTVSAALAKELAHIAQASGFAAIDAPVSGGQAGAESGQLTVMAGGEGGDVARAEPVMRAYAKRVGHMGGPGAGQTTKMVNQICIAGVLQGLAEGVNFALEAGLEPAKVFDVIGKGAAQSWQMDNRAATMATGEYDFGFAVDWMRKDLAIALAEADRLGAPLPLTALVDQFYKDVQQTGGGRWDTSSLLTRLRR
ncbi:MAG: NAD(P)-dependent oxidoreductase [Pseudomonadota bacterium]